MGITRREGEGSLGNGRDGEEEGLLEEEYPTNNHVDAYIIQKGEKGR